MRFVGLTHIESTLLPVSLELSETRRKEEAAAMKQQAIQYLALDEAPSPAAIIAVDTQGAVLADRPRLSHAPLAAPSCRLWRGCHPARHLRRDPHSGTRIAGTSNPPGADQGILHGGEPASLHLTQS